MIQNLFWFSLIHNHINIFQLFLTFCDVIYERLRLRYFQISELNESSGCHLSDRFVFYGNPSIIKSDWQMKDIFKLNNLWHSVHPNKQTNNKQQQTHLFSFSNTAQSILYCINCVMFSSLALKHLTVHPSVRTSTWTPLSVIYRPCPWQTNGLKELDDGRFQRAKSGLTWTITHQGDFEHFSQEPINIVYSPLWMETNIFFKCLFL